MIKATMNWNEMRFEIEGHAKADEPGKDIVCSAASMLIQALAKSLLLGQQRGRMETRIKYNERDETLISAVSANPNAGSIQEAKSYFRMCVNGMRMLAEAYPKNVKMTEVG